MNVHAAKAQGRLRCEMCNCREDAARGIEPGCFAYDCPFGEKEIVEWRIDHGWRFDNDYAD